MTVASPGSGAEIRAPLTQKKKTEIYVGTISFGEICFLQVRVEVAGPFMS